MHRMKYCWSWMHLPVRMPSNRPGNSWLSPKSTAIALTKLDGTAKGGVVIGISDQFKIPVKYIGIGEKMEDLQLFDRVEFVESLFT